MDFETVPPRVYDCFQSLPPAEVLVSMVINLDVTNRSGKSAFHHAAFRGHLEMLSLLQLKGANVRAVDRGTRPPSTLQPSWVSSSTPDSLCFHACGALFHV